MPSDLFGDEIKRGLELLDYFGEGFRVGADAVSILEFERQSKATGGEHFLQTRFTRTELDYASGRMDRLAARWAAKEAVVKAIGTGFRGIRPDQIDIVREPGGRPQVRRAGYELWPYNAHAWRWEVTMSHEGDAALAVAVGVFPLSAQPLSTVIR